MEEKNVCSIRARRLCLLASPVRPPRKRAWEPTELSRVKHYVLHGISLLHGDQGGGGDLGEGVEGEWVNTYGIYLCEESLPECKLPFFEQEEMYNSPYRPYNMGK